MRMYRRKRIAHGLLLGLLLVLALSLTAVVQAGGENQPVPPAKDGPPGGPPPGGKQPGGPMPGGRPPGGQPPMAKPAGPMASLMPELQNCIGVITWYDGNLNGIVDANEDAMDGASVLLMTEAPPPSMEPPIGPDGKAMGMPEGPMGPGHGPPMAMGKGPMGPPPGGPMRPKQMPDDGFAKFQVQDRRITRDGGIAAFCDLQPGKYILQGDAVDGITFGDNRQFIMLEEGGFAIVTFGFSYLNGGPETTNGNGA